MCRLQCSPLLNNARLDGWREESCDRRIRGRWSVQYLLKALNATLYLGGKKNDNNGPECTAGGTVKRVTSTLWHGNSRPCFLWTKVCTVRSSAQYISEVCPFSEYLNVIVLSKLWNDQGFVPFLRSANLKLCEVAAERVEPSFLPVRLWNKKKTRMVWLFRSRVCFLAEAHGENNNSRVWRAWAGSRRRLAWLSTNNWKLQLVWLRPKVNK